MGAMGVRGPPVSCQQVLSSNLEVHLFIVKADEGQMNDGLWAVFQKCHTKRVIPEYFSNVNDNTSLATKLSNSRVVEVLEYRHSCSG